MKSKTTELLDHSIAAIVAAMEIYNKPNFLYREESFSILALNSWELLIKAKWLYKNSNKVRTLYMQENKKNKDGSASKRNTIKKTRSGNPHIHSIGFICKKLVESKELDIKIWNNIQALMELRDSSIHFYNNDSQFSNKLKEISLATVMNYVLLIKEWFNRDLSKFNFYIMPLSFISIPKSTGVILNHQEKNFLKYIDELEKGASTDIETKYAITVHIDIKLTRSKAKDAPNVRISNEPSALKIQLTEEQIREKYPWDYKKLTKKCASRYKHFKINQDYHDVRKELFENDKYCLTRYLDPINPKSQKRIFYNSNILKVLDIKYKYNRD